MKRSKFTSFLFTIALGLFFVTGVNAQTSLDCQDEVNISTTVYNAGTADAFCSAEVPWKAFTTWMPSCMVILNSAGDTITKIGPACPITFTQLTYDTVWHVKTDYTTRQRAWNRTCDPASAPAAVLYGPTLSAGTPAAGVHSRTVTDTVGAAGYGNTLATISGYNNGFTQSTVPNCTSPATTNIEDWEVALKYIDSTSTITSSPVTMTVTNEFKEAATGTYVDIWYDGGAPPTTGSGSLYGGASCGYLSYEYHLYADNPVTANSNYCWGKVNFEDKEFPALTGKADSVVCSDVVDWTDYSKCEGDVSAAAATSILDSKSTVEAAWDLVSCSGSISSVTNTWGTDVCGYITHERVWTATKCNSYGTQSKIIRRDTVVVEPTHIDFIIPPTAVVERECGSDLDPKSLVRFEKSTHTDDRVKDGFPTVKTTVASGATAKYGSYIPINYGLCNLNVTMSDVDFHDLCGINEKILRTWTAIDWCTGTDTTYTQLIKTVDTDAPKFHSTSKSTFSGTIEPWICETRIELKVSGYDDCGAISITYQNLMPDVLSLKGDEARAKVVGTFTNAVEAVLTDACGNVAKETLTIIVSDDVAPVAVAHDEINVSLTGGEEVFTDGVAKVHTASIDNGSHDAGCGEVEKCVLLKDELDNPTGIPAWTYYHLSSSSRTSKSQLSLAGGGGLPLGWVPANCGGADGVAYTYAVYDATGRATLIGSVPYVVCKDFVKFCCEDSGENLVALIVEDGAGNKGYSWTKVIVEDKSAPGWYCPPGNLKCTDMEIYKPQTPTFGGAICSGFTVTEVSRRNSVTCGDGYLWITWSAADADGNEVSTRECRYYVYSVDTFKPEEIKWPKHYDGHHYQTIVRECVNSSTNTSPQDAGSIVNQYGAYWASTDACEVADHEGPTWCQYDCGLVGVTSSDLLVEAGDACKKIIRTWVVIDWCEYDANDVDAADQDETFAAYDDRWLPNEFNVLNPANGGGYVASKGDNQNLCLTCHNSGTPDGIYFAYSGTVDHDGYYSYDQIIKIVDDAVPTIAVEDTDVEVTGDADKNEASDCTGSDTITATAADVCGDSDADPSSLQWYIHTEDGTGKVIAGPKTVNGAEASMTTASGEAGDVHTIVWRVSDGCGNTTTVKSKHTFVDTKAPVIICISDLSISAMSTDGSAEIWASDYADAVDCQDYVIGFKDDEGNIVANKGFTCDDLGGNVAATVEFSVFAVDGNGNEGECEVSLRIVDNNGACGNTGATSGIIAGEVRTALGDMVESANVSLASESTNTSVDGKYAFDDNAMFLDYSVSAEKNDDHLNGVSTLDLVLIQKHILGLEILDSPYKVIASDINNDSKVSAIDLVELRKVILGINSEFPSNNSWRFVDANQSFDDELAPFPFTEAIDVNFLAGDDMDNDFLAVKIGDVSGNAAANSLIAAGRSNGTLALNAEDATIAAGDVVLFEVRSSDVTAINAIQFTLNTTGLEFNGVIGGTIEMTEQNVAAFDGAVTAAWSSVNAASTDGVLMTLEFTATADVTLSSAISLGSNITTAAAYSTAADQLDVTLAFDNVASGLELFQNEPNPFAETTTIGFNLPTAGTATLSVFDVTGKTIRVINGTYSKGQNTITLSDDDLNATGVLYYQLETSTETATMKMIKIN